MPYKCVHCSALYKDDAPNLLSGCDTCKGKFFFYIKEEKAKLLQQANVSELSDEEKKQMEQDVREIAGIESEDTPVFLDFESVKVIKPGKYLIDLSKLFAMDRPRVYQLEDGKYIVDLSSRKS